MSKIVLGEGAVSVFGMMKDIRGRGKGNNLQARERKSIDNRCRLQKQELEKKLEKARVT